MTAKARRANVSLLENIGLELLKADPEERFADSSLRIEYIPAELIRCSHDECCPKRYTLLFMKIDNPYTGTQGTDSSSASCCSSEWATFYRRPRLAP
jgi:hypothetical protein